MSLGLGDQAYVNYQQGLTKGVMTAIPRNKFSFTVSLNTIDGPVDLTRIAQVMMPSFVFRTQTINRYNDKHVVQTGIDYTPITLTAYDNKDAEFEKFLKDYARHYVAGPMNNDDYADWLTSPKGIKVPVDGHYIRSMIITRIDATEGKKVILSNVIEIFHPFITNADADTLDYSDSTPTVFRISFNYEGYRILSENSAPPPQVEKPVETIVPLEHVKEHTDTSGTYETTTKVDGTTKLESNKAELIAYQKLTEEATDSVRRQGIAGTSFEEREARAASITTDANKVENNDAVFEHGSNEIVTIDGQQYMISRETHPELFTEEHGYGN